MNFHTPPAIPETAKEIGRKIADLVPSGSTLQLGIGSVPDAVLELMTQRKDLRIWTEMFSDGVLDLFKAGVLDDEMPLKISNESINLDELEIFDINKDDSKKAEEEIFLDGIEEL